MSDRGPVFGGGAYVRVQLPPCMVCWASKAPGLPGPMRFFVEKCEACDPRTKVFRACEKCVMRFARMFTDGKIDNSTMPMLHAAYCKGG